MLIGRGMAAVIAGAVALGSLACGSTKSDAGVPPTAAPPATAATAASQAPPATTAAALTDWPMFGLTSSRPSATNAATGITASNVGALRRVQVRTPGTIDSTPIILGDTAYATTTYGKTIAVDLRRGTIRWTFTPRVFAKVAGTPQITNASPAADPSRRFVFTASPDGAIHKLSVDDGTEAEGWPVVITRDPTHEKLTSSLNVSGPRVIATMGGYIGDAPPYQGKVVTIDRRSGRIAGVFNSLCSNRRRIITPSTCRSTESAIWGRAGAVVLPGGDLLAATSNGPFDGVHDWGDSVVRLSPTAGRLLRHWTPREQARYEAQDIDVGSTSPAYLGAHLVVQGGKDGKLHLLDLRRSLHGVTGAAGKRLGGDLQVLPTPGGEQMFTAPAVWRSGGRTVVVVTTGAGTTAYRVRSRRLKPVWGNRRAGTSPIVAGGLLYVYDPTGSGVHVYEPATGRQVGTLEAGEGHWNSPVAASGHLVLGEGNANAHESKSGVLDVWTAR